MTPNDSQNAPSPQTEAQDNKAELTAIALAQYRSIYDQATDAWKRSQEERMVETVEESGSAADFKLANAAKADPKADSKTDSEADSDADPKADSKTDSDADSKADPETDPKAKIRMKKTLRSESQTGDATYLAKALDAVKGICALMGLDAPRRRELTGSGGRPIELADVAPDDLRLLTDEQTDALEARFLARDARAAAAEESPKHG